MEENNKKQFQASTKEHSLVGDIGKYVVEEYVVPKSKDLLHDMLSGLAGMVNDSVQGALNKAIYGEDKSRRTGSSYSTQRSGYTTYSRPATQQIADKRDAVGKRSSVDVRYVWVDDEQTAREIISSLKEMVDNYKKAKVADLYEMLTPKIQTSFTDYKYGWTDASQFSYHKEYTGEHRGQYLIDLPKPEDVTNI
jgi:hypothetical protein